MPPVGISIRQASTHAHRGSKRTRSARATSPRHKTLPAHQARQPGKQDDRRKHRLTSHEAIHINCGLLRRYCRM